jgi:hypothetical protein
MAAPHDAGYRHPDDWPVFAEARETDALAELAVRWIAMNREFIRERLPKGSDHREVISLLMYRAQSGGGLAIPLKKHTDGQEEIKSPVGLLLQHAFWAAGECRRSAASPQEEVAADWTDPATTTMAPPITDPEDNASGYIRLVSALVDEFPSALTAARPEEMPQQEVERLRAVRHAKDCLPTLWKIFCRYAPAAVIEEASTLNEDSRACLLLAIFPAQLPHAAVATYRQLALTNKHGSTTVPATQKKIWRLRKQIRAVWPSELAPKEIRNPRPERECGSGEEAS